VPGDTKPGAAERHHILLIEDDEAIGRLVRMVLEGSQYRVTVCADRETTLATLLEDPAEAVIVEVAPSVAGAQLSLLREVGQTPVIVLTDIDDEATLVECLKAGAFDIALKPFAPEDIEACVGLAIGAKVAGTSALPSLKGNTRDLDFASLQATRGGLPVSLSLSEWRFIEALAGRPGQTVLYQEILRHMYGRVYREYPRLLQAWAARLSKKVGLAEFHGLGYALLV
jgi:DNA-binding response OmpR family regulator